MKSMTTNNSFYGSHLLPIDSSTPCHSSHQIQQISLCYDDSAKLNVSGCFPQTNEHTHHVIIPSPMSTPKLILSSKIVADKNSNTAPEHRGKTIFKGNESRRYYQRSCMYKKDTILI